MHPLGCAGLVVPHNLEHLALLLPDHLVKRDTRLVVVRGVDGSARCPVLCFGQYMVDVVHPRDPPSPAARQARRITARHAATSSLELNLPTTVPSRRSTSTWRATAPSWEPLSPRLCPMDRRSPAPGRACSIGTKSRDLGSAPAAEHMERICRAWSSHAGQGSSYCPQQARVSRPARHPVRRLRL